MRRIAIGLSVLMLGGAVGAPLAAQDSVAALERYAQSLVASEAAGHGQSGVGPYGTGQALRTRAGALDTITPPPSFARLHGQLVDAAESLAHLGPRAHPIPSEEIEPCYRANPSASSSCRERNVPVTFETNRYNVATNQYGMTRRKIADRLCAAGVELPTPGQEQTCPPSAGTDGS